MGKKRQRKKYLENALALAQELEETELVEVLQKRLIQNSNQN